MRIIRLANTPVIMRIRRRDEITVVVPTNTSTPDVLAVAGLVLSNDEFTELQAAMTDPRSTVAVPRHQGWPGHLKSE
jgi:hypothetical protein